MRDRGPRWWPPRWWRSRRRRPRRPGGWKVRLKEALGLNIFLCDDCKWNWPSACHRPERPNAVECPDYTRKGR